MSEPWPEGWGTSLRRAVHATHARALPAPERFGSFYAHASLGTGGQGSVFLATGDPAGKAMPVVVKSFLPGQERARIERSVLLQTRLLDPQGLVSPVPHVLAWDLDRDEPWVAQQYGGVDLATLKKHGWDHWEDIYEGLVRAVLKLHRAGVLHRDIKPQNILADPRRVGSPRVVLCDLDLSRAEGQMTLTRSGYAMGTLAFAPPEQLLGKKPSPASDVYSVAATILFLATGKLPADAVRGWLDAGVDEVALDEETRAALGAKANWVQAALCFYEDRRPPLEDLQNFLEGREGRFRAQRRGLGGGPSRGGGPSARRGKDGGDELAD